LIHQKTLASQTYRDHAHLRRPSSAAFCGAGEGFDHIKTAFGALIEDLRSPIPIIKACVFLLVVRGGIFI
jgi:hypothetical protein